MKNQQEQTSTINMNNNEYTLNDIIKLTKPSSSEGPTTTTTSVYSTIMEQKNKLTVEEEDQQRNDKEEATCSDGVRFLANKNKKKKNDIDRGKELIKFNNKKKQ